MIVNKSKENNDKINIQYTYSNFRLIFNNQEAGIKHNFRSLNFQGHPLQSRTSDH
jgi:hypothetical protein